MALKLEPDAVVFFSHQDWWYHNPASSRRVAWCVSRERLTLFVNSIGMGMPPLRSRDFLARVSRKIKSYCKHLKRVDGHLHVMTPIAIPSVKSCHFTAINCLLLRVQMMATFQALHIRHPLVVVANPFFLPVIRSLPKAVLAYQVTDRYVADESRDLMRLKALHDDLTASADHIFCSGKLNYDEFRTMRTRVHFLPHGVDYEHFASSPREPTVPDELRGLPRPIVGYVGVMERKTLDDALLHAVMDANPDIVFVFIGILSKGLRGLTRHTNGIFLGRRDYAVLPQYVRAFDACIMPFNQSQWVRHCNPVKLNEYLAAGKPVVSTFFPELESYSGVVYCAEDHLDFTCQLRTALEENSPDAARLRQERVRCRTWDLLARQMLDTMTAGLAA